MSKIEQALNKAKKGNNFARVVTQQQRSDLVVKDLVVRERSLIERMRSDLELSKSDLESRSIIFHHDENTAVTDSFRELRTQVLKRAGNENFSVLVLSFSGCDDGDFVAINMGASFALEENKTSLIIDCNTDSSKFEEMTSSDYEYGLADYIRNSEIDVSDIIQDVGLRRLRVIQLGMVNSANREFATSPRMRGLMRDLVERYHDRYIILNGPPIDTSADANILIELVDYVVVVLPYGVVLASELKEAIKKIDKRKLLGVVMNNAPDDIV